MVFFSFVLLIIIVGILSKSKLEIFGGWEFYKQGNPFVAFSKAKDIRRRHVVMIDLYRT